MGHIIVRKYQKYYNHVYGWSKLDLRLQKISQILMIRHQSKQYKNVKELKFIFMAFNLQHQGWSLYYQGWEKFLHKIFMANEKAKDVYMTDEEEKSKVK